MATSSLAASSPSCSRARFAVGLTGGIGSGKSVVAGLFAGLGAGIVDTDAIARALTAAGGAAIEPIRAAFGDDFIAADGALDRARMRHLVFDNPEQRGRLEAILHPLIGAAAEARAESLSSAPYLIFDVPLLVECGAWRRRVHRVLVIDCPAALQIERVVRTRGLTMSEARAIVTQQATRRARLDAADDVIENAGELELVPPRVARLHEAYRAAAASRARMLNEPA